MQQDANDWIKRMPTFIVKQSRYFARCATMWLVLMAVGSAFADNSKISPDLLPLLSNPTNTVNVNTWTVKTIRYM